MINISILSIIIIIIIIINSVSIIIVVYYCYNYYYYYYYHHSIPETGIPPSPEAPLIDGNQRVLNEGEDSKFAGKRAKRLRY